MVKEYYFEICDENDLNIEYEITGEEYKNFIETCFRYSKYFSLEFRKANVSLADEISDSEFCPVITQEKKKMWFLEHGICFSEFLSENYMKEQYDAYWARKYYLCDELTKSYLINFGSLFEYLWQSWDNNEDCAENLTFYRPDDSVLFVSITHEGMCSLYLHQDENFEDVLKNPQWRLKKKDR